ncbi:MAG: phenylacetate-CoA oxygenase/reductase subunit PaaK [Pseudomonadales bacterium]|nr:phenylacetate-CoA oxygenase/reductase subunit PaaK [Pseudomonadales bacterium]MCP5214921.1 phenylacetate-CoA oxygenase/reductase subunit PaaK [Pseudomonadales bacterium]
MSSNTGFFSLQIADVRPETDKAVCVSFEVPEDLADTFRFKQGQYITLETEINNEPVRRSYSICSGVFDKRLSVAIKRVEGGVFSNYANEHLKAGDTIKVMPPQGNFFVPVAPEKARKYLFIAAGSGITPIISNIKTILQAEPNSLVTLLLGNQRSSTIMFRDQLSFLKNRYMTRFQWVNILSKEDQGSDLLSGRINNRKGGELNKRLITIAEYDEYFICGPESMISEVSRGLRATGADESTIHYELFASSAEDARAIIERHHARAIKMAGKSSRVTIVADGRSSEFELTADGENILDAGMAHGFELPYSCKGGVCSTCKAKLVSGEVEMDITHGLEESEIANGFILTCQAHPVSESVVVDFDQK